MQGRVLVLTDDLKREVPGPLKHFQRLPGSLKFVQLVQELFDMTENVGCHSYQVRT